MEINDFKVNHVYNNTNITESFKCSSQGGMRKSNKTKTLVLVSNHTGLSIYGDKWISGQVHYTGMGQEGHQSLTYMQNKTLNELETNDITAYLFEVFNAGEYTFAGEVRLAGEPYSEQEKDKNGDLRTVYRFPLELIDDSYAPSKEKLNLSNKRQEEEIHKIPEIELEKIARQRSSLNKGKNKKRKTTTDTYERDQVIKRYVRSLANGVCQLCENPAPFNVNDEPFLEVHHIEYLSHGGEDTIDNSIALCPNCHRKIHKLNLEEDKERLLHKARERED